MGVKTRLKKSSNAAASASGEVLSRDGEIRAEVLKEWRKKYADELDLPAFMVFSNKTLHDLAIKNPKSSGDLEKIYGLGPKKIDAFGGKLLSALSEL
jgi:ATP-dependent DNA helicase RecQ